ncbi:MAG: DUF1588 domain-containing protein, partial [Planctomycetaceae bacterium]|nr:DUF1588 domain-containing protein [Planctomycetaceae bacterium]
MRLIFLGCLFVYGNLARVDAQNPPASASRSENSISADHQASYRDAIAPLLERACSSCHSEESAEGGFIVTALDGSLDQAAEVAAWKKIRTMVISQSMPPKDADPLSVDDIATVASWIDAGLERERERLRGTTTRHVARRLTSREFNRSLLRLVGAESSVRDFPYDEKVPVDAFEKSGFSNDAHTNPLTKSHLEGLKLSALAALRDFAPFVEQSRSPIHYFYDGEFCYTSRATQDHIFDFVKNVVHPMTEVEFQSRREIMQLKGNSFLNRPMNKAVFGPALFPFKPGPLQAFENDLLLSNAAAFPASQMYSRGRFTFRVRVRGKPGADGTLPLMRIKAGFFDVFANHFRTVDSVQVAADEQVFEFAGNVRDFPFLDSIPPEHTYRDGNVPRLTTFATNDWGNCMGAFFVILVENASRHDEGLSLAPGHHRISLGNIHIGSYAEIMERARNKTLPNYYMQDYELVEVFNKTQQELAGKAPAIEIDWAELTLDDVPINNTVFFESSDRGPNEVYAAQVIERFVTRACRGFAMPEDVQTFVRLYRTLREQGLGFEPAIHEVLASVLISPKHLFITDFSSPPDRYSRALLLAEKLAFWLWGEPPDERLLTACADGALLDDHVLQAEVNRMFLDPRLRQFVDNFFAEAWHLDGFDRIAVDATRYAFYDPELENDIREQFRRTVHSALGLPGTDDIGPPLTSTAGVVSLIDDDHLWLNPRLAKLYGVDGYNGQGEFVNVKLPEGSPHGGVLTQSLIMKMNSDGTDSHPIRRGTWVLERILFDPPPPPPKVTPLKEQGLIKAKTLRERIAEHAQSNSSCVSCHRRIDPFGLAFENFDAVGGWRETVAAEDGQQPVELSLVLDGNIIHSPDELKKYILNHRLDAFARGFVKSLLQYAVGRQLDLLDDDSVERAQRAFVTANYDFKVLVQAVATCESFRASE